MCNLKYTAFISCKYYILLKQLLVVCDRIHTLTIGVTESRYESRCRDAIYRVSTMVLALRKIIFIHEISDRALPACTIMHTSDRSNKILIIY
ncbi:hypothetical protein BLD44_026280 [Mastigocladus laminosus UU774]|nr:hypothetical protein BLD44_026280 [Mastigocladus laminosus UU774]